MKAEQLTAVQYHKLQDAKAIAQSLCCDGRTQEKAYAALTALNALIWEAEKYAKREEVALPF